MYAIIDDRGSQYKVQEGDTLEIQLHDLPEGADKIVFDRVLMLGEGDSARVGQPYVASAKVSAAVLGQVKGDKVRIFKFRRRKDSRLTKGHRQKYLRVKIEKIEA